MSDDLEDLVRLKAAYFEPLSFRERGITLPFTTPALVGGRIREAALGAGFELILVNPSGGRGALILPWEALNTICSPTLFDRHLLENLAKAEDISPLTVRREAERLAMQNLAGKHAAMAAREAARQRELGKRALRAMLLESLMIASLGRSQAASQTNEADPNYHKLARRAVMKSAEAAQMPVAEFADDLEEVIEILAGSVPRVAGEDAPLRQLLGDLERLVDEITNWAHRHPPESLQFHATRFIEENVRQTIDCAEFVLATTEALIANFGLLAANWKSDREAVFDRAIRPEYVLDGWKTPVTLWDAAGPSQRASALVDIALIAPILPREAKTWLGKSSAWFDVPRRVANTVREKADWRSGNALEMVARTENLVNFVVVQQNRLTPLGQVETKTRLAKPPSRSGLELQKKKGKEHAGPHPMHETPGTAQPDIALGRRNRAKKNRAIANQLEVASDEALTKIVAVVDGLADPEMRLRILGPSLHRLKRLRPPRPVSLMRLLFLPLSGAFVEPAKWQSGDGRIPRSAIKPMMETLEAQIKPRIEGIERDLRGKSFDDLELVAKLGGDLWRMAADAEKRLRSSPLWKHAGFGSAEIDSFLPTALGLWRHGEDLWRGMHEATGQGRPDLLRAALIGPAAEGRAVFLAAFSALLERAQRPSVFAALLQDMPAQVSDIFENLLMQCVGDYLDEISEFDFAPGAQLAADIGLLLNSLEEWHLTRTRLDAKKLFAYRRNLDHYCMTTYREIVAVHLTKALLELHGDQPSNLAEVEALAEVARSLEETGKRFGPPEGYDVLRAEFLLQMKEAQQDNAPLAAFSREITRIKEILIGPRAADRPLAGILRPGGGLR